MQTCVHQRSLTSRVLDLRLNRTKSVEMVFVPPRSRRSIVITLPAVPGFERVESIKALGVTISVMQHVNALLTLFALRTLRQHGMPSIALCAVFQAIVVKLSYAVSAWWRYASSADRGRLEALLRRSVCSDTETRQLLYLLISVRKRKINCFTIYCIMINICSAHSSHQKGTKIILSITTVTTCSCQFAPPPSITITFKPECFLKIYHTLVSQVQQCNS